MTLADGSTIVFRGVSEVSRAAADSALSAPVRSVLAAVAWLLSQLEASLGSEGVFHPQQMCLEASRIGKTLLAERGLEFEILGGDIVLSKSEALEHHVLLHRDGSHAVVVDLTASQLPWFERTETVVAIAADSQAALSDVLSREWHWYVPQSELAIVATAEPELGESHVAARLAKFGGSREAAAAHRGLGADDFLTGALLQLGGHSEQAEAVLRRADADGSADAAAILGLLLNARGEVQQAEAAFRRADERGDAEAAGSLGTLLLGRRKLEEAEAVLRRGDARGSGRAAFSLAAVLHERGEMEQAEDALRRADARGHADAATTLGLLHKSRGEFEQAEAAFRRGNERRGRGTHWLTPTRPQTRPSGTHTS